MRIVITEKQFKKIVLKSIGNQELSEEGDGDGGAPESGASSDGEKKTGATKWESGVTRGPANQIGNTKWSEIVGSQLKRGKANPLTEQGPKTHAPVAVYDKSKLLSAPKVIVGRPRNEPEEQLKGKIIFEDTFKTFWGQDIVLPLDGRYEIILWGPSDSRQKAWEINSNGNWVIHYKYKDGSTKEFEYPPPPEGYLRKLFPDNTIRNIKDTKTGKQYGTVVHRVDLNAKWNEDLKKDRSLMAGAINLEKPQAIQWIPTHYAYIYIPDTKYYLGKEEAFMNMTKAKVSTDYTEITLTHYTEKNDAARYFARKSYNGLDVPKGFDPNKYDEYIQKRQLLEKQLKAKISALKRAKEKYGGADRSIDEFKLQIIALKKEIDNLYKKYASPIGEGGVPEFSYGITEKQREAYFRFLNDINTKYDPLIKQAETIRDKQYESDVKNDKIEFDQMGQIILTSAYKTADENVEKIKKEKDAKLEWLKTTFGYDYWKPSILGKEFDEFWDDWGTGIQIVGNIVFILASGGIAGFLEGTALAAYRALAVPVGDALFNGLVAAYQKNRGQDAEAAISVVCVLVPFAKYFGNIGKISHETAVELATKIRSAKAGLFADPERLRNFIALLSDEERYVLRNVVNLPRESVQEGLDLFFKDFNKLAGKDIDYFVRNYGIGTGGQYVKVPGAEIAKTSFRTWGPPFLKEIGFEAGLPLATSLINSFGKFIENNEFKYNKDELLNIKNTLQKAVLSGGYEEFEVYMTTAKLATDIAKGEKSATEMIGSIVSTLNKYKITNITEPEAKKIHDDMEKEAPGFKEEIKKVPKTQVVIPVELLQPTSDSLNNKK